MASILPSRVAGLPVSVFFALILGLLLAISNLQAVKAEVSDDDVDQPSDVEETHSSDDTGSLDDPSDEDEEQEEDVDVRGESVESDDSTATSESFDSQQEETTPVSVTHWILHKYPSDLITLSPDESLTILCGLVNEGDTEIKVQHIAGVINTVDMKYSIQNLSAVTYDKIIAPNDEMTFSYNVEIRDKREGVQGLILLAVYYADSERPYSRLFVNQTVEVVETKKSSTSSNLLTYGLAGIAVALLGITAATVIRGLSSGKTLETGTRSGSSGGNEWTDNYNTPKASGLRKRK